MEDQAQNTDVIAGQDVIEPEPAQGVPDSEVQESTPPAEETYSREYVDNLRQENAKYRTRAKEVDGLKARLFEALVKADGRLQDATDLPFDEALLDVGLEDAITELITAKPHLKARRVQGDIGAGKRGSSSDEFDLLGAIRNMS